MRAPVRCREADADRLLAGRAQSDREVRGNRPALALTRRDVVDREGRQAVVVHDRPIPWPSEIVAFVGLERLRKYVSVLSSITSPLTWTVTILDVSPGAKVSVPCAPGSRRAPVPFRPRLRSSTDTARPLAASSVTVNLAFSFPVSPSMTATSLTESAGSASSSVIVPAPCPSVIVAFVGFVRLTK